MTGRRETTWISYSIAIAIGYFATPLAHAELPVLGIGGDGDPATRPFYPLDAVFNDRSSSSAFRVASSPWQRAADVRSGDGRATGTTRSSDLGAADSDDKFADESSFRIGGFVEALGAYTYASPAHWSRGVGRLSLSAQGGVGENFKWKIGGRADVDPVYSWSDFYLNPVKRDQRTNFVHGENYLDYSTGDWSFRVGAQHIIWGEVVGLFYADVVSARDTREFLLPSFDLIRIPQWAARAEYFAGDSHIEVIWIPIPTFDRFGKPGADFYPAPLPSPLAADIAALIHDPDRPSHKLSNSSYGVRANTLIASWDLSAFYYRSFSTAPTLYRLPSSADVPLSFQWRYDRLWQAGGSLSKDFSDFVLRAETVYTRGQGFTLADFTGPQSVEARSSLDYIVSADFSLPGDTRLNIQGFQRIFFGGGREMAIKSDGVGASILLSKKVTPTLEPQILWIQNFRDAGGLIRPKLNWYVQKNTTVDVGIDIFTGSADGFFGRYNNRDRVYAEVRFDF